MTDTLGSLVEPIGSDAANPIRGPEPLEPLPFPLEPRALTGRPRLSVVIPAFNEEAVLERTGKGARGVTRRTRRRVVGALRERRQPRLNGARARTAPSCRRAVRLSPVIPKFRPSSRAHRGARLRRRRRHRDDGCGPSASARGAARVAGRLAPGLRRRPHAKDHDGWAFGMEARGHAGCLLVHQADCRHPDHSSGVGLSAARRLCPPGPAIGLPKSPACIAA